MPYEDGSPVVLGVGRFDRAKNFDLLIKSVAAMQQELPVRLVLLGEGQFGFAVDGRDAQRPLVIDPLLTWVTRLGGSSNDWPGLRQAIDRAPDGRVVGDRVRLADFDHPAVNDWVVINQFSVQEGQHTRRPDLVVFVNGLPLVVIELKDPADTAATLDVAIDQLGRYKTIAADLFVPNLLLVASDGLLTRVGSVTSGRQRFMPWRPATSRKR